jgi:hypothetical protein
METWFMFRNLSLRESGKWVKLVRVADATLQAEKCPPRRSKLTRRKTSILQQAIKRGLRAFLDRMIGVAKKAKVLPSTPMRAIPTKKPPPPFFQFVLEALAISRDVIRSSPLPPHQKAAALSILQIKATKR